MRKFFIVISLLLLSQSAYAQQQVTKQNKTPVFTAMCYKNVIEMVANRNLDVNIAKAAIEQAKANYISSFAPLFPSVRGQVSSENFNGGEVIYFSEPITIQRTTLRPTLSLDYQVPLGGKTFWDIGVYKSKYIRAQKAYDTAFQQTLYNISVKYFDWLRAFANYKNAQQTLGLAKKQYELNKDKADSGFGTQLDVLQSETQMSEKENEVLDAEHNLVNTQTELAVALNFPPGEKIAPDKEEINPFNFYFGDINLPNLYDIAQKNRSDIKELEFMVREAKNEYKSAVSDILPTVNFSAYTRGIGPAMSELQNTRQSMLGMDVNLLRYMGVNTFANIQEARAKLKVSILQKEKKIDEIYESITKAYNDYFLNVRKLGVARKQIDTAKKAYDIAIARLETGVGINLEVLKAQSDLTKAQFDYQTAIMNNNVSQLRLIYEIGLLSPRTVESFIDGEKPLERFLPSTAKK